MSITTKGIAVVTGAAQGIGRAIALRLARDGYDISVNDLNTNKKNLETVTNEITGVGRRVYPFIGDVSKEEDVKNLVSKTAKELGSVDVVRQKLFSCGSISVLYIPKYQDGSQCGD